jgi:hypothetical protein
MVTKTRPEDVPVEITQRPPDPTAEELALAQDSTTVVAPVAEVEKPSFEPPTTARGAAVQAAAGWLTNKHVLMLWQTQGATDAWIFLDGGTGWLRLTQASDVAARGLDLLAAGGRAAGRIVHAYQGATGTIDGLYLW